MLIRLMLFVYNLNFWAAAKCVTQPAIACNHCSHLWSVFCIFQESHSDRKFSVHAIGISPKGSPIKLHKEAMRTQSASAAYTDSDKPVRTISSEEDFSGGY